MAVGVQEPRLRLGVIDMKSVLSFYIALPLKKLQFHANPKHERWKATPSCATGSWCHFCDSGNGVCPQGGLEAPLMVPTELEPHPSLGLPLSEMGLYPVVSDFLWTTWLLWATPNPSESQNSFF